MAKKYNYIIIVNKKINGKANKDFSYSFGRTKNIKLEISKNFARVSFSQQSLRSLQMVIDGNDKLFNDAIKKIMLIHQILYNKPINVDSIKIMKKDDLFIDVDENPIYSLVRNAKTQFSKEWQCLIPLILNTSISKEDERSAVIKSLILADNENSSSIKFMYLWMAMNGFYKRIISLAKTNNVAKENDFNKAFKKETDTLSICFLARMLFGSNCFFGEKDKKKLISSSISKLSAIEIEVPKSQTIEALNNKDNVINNALSTLSLSNNRGYTCACFMLLWLPYQIRCMYFHSEVSLPIYAHKNESILKVLDIINDIIRTFLLENIPNWFIDDIKEENIEKLQTVINCITSI